MQHRIMLADSRDLSLLDTASVQLIVTSPPYWQIKDYAGTQQIGFYDTYEEYVNNLNLVWQECERVLETGCKMVVNVGDQFARASIYGRYKVVPIRTEIIRFLEYIGLDYMGAIIWQKVTTCNTSGGAFIMGSYPFPRNGIIKLDYEFILIFRKQGKASTVSSERKIASKLTEKEWNTYFYGHWNFTGERQRLHPAPFPVELPRRLIKMFSFKGETVLDPFLGSGTTILAAMEQERSSVGYECNPEYVEVIKKRLEVGSNQLISPVNVKFVQVKYKEIDLQKRMSNLPYVFKDPCRFNRKQ